MPKITKMTKIMFYFNIFKTAYLVTKGYVTKFLWPSDTTRDISNGIFQELAQFSFLGLFGRSQKCQKSLICVHRWGMYCQILWKCHFWEFHLKMSQCDEHVTISQSTFFTPYHGWVTMILRVPWARVISQKSAKKHFLVLGAADLTKSHISWFLTWKNEIRISNHSLSQSSNVLVALAQLHVTYSKMAFS